MTSAHPPLELRYGSAVVGKIHGAFEHQKTWFGEFELNPSLTTAPDGQRITDFHRIL